MLRKTKKKEYIEWPLKMKLIRKQFKYAQEIPKLPNGEHSDANTPGLFLIKRESSKHTWSYLYRVSGKQKRWTLGKLEKISLKQAREMVHKSADPVGDKKRLRIEESKKVSFSSLAERYIEEHAKKSQKYWRQTQTALRHKRFKSLARRDVSEIEKRNVKKLLAEIPGNGLANQTRALLHSIFNFAIEEDILTLNPVTRIKRRQAASRTRVLNDEEIRAAWSVPLFRVLLLTLQRPTNCKEILRSEIVGNKWTIPADKFKTKITHVVPLVDTALETLSEIPNPDDNDNYFTFGDCLDLVKVLSDLGVPNAQPKDIQRTVRTRLSELGVAQDACERLQGHALPGIRAVYDRCEFFEAKLNALRLWETELLRIVNKYDRFYMDPDLEMRIHPFVGVKK